MHTVSILYNLPVGSPEVCPLIVVSFYCQPSIFFYRIYHGTNEIFDIFNPKAFLYWNADNPAETIAEIRRLEANKTAYKQMQNEPILKDGNRTIQKYFSLSDDIIPNAQLKRRIRDMMLTHC